MINSLTFNGNVIEEDGGNYYISIFIPRDMTPNIMFYTSVTSNGVDTTGGLTAISGGEVQTINGSFDPGLDFTYFSNTDNGAVDSNYATPVYVVRNNTTYRWLVADSRAEAVDITIDYRLNKEKI